MKRALSFLITLSLAGCLPGPGALISDANVEIVITGVEVGDIVDLDLDDRESSVVVNEAGALSLFELLAPDEYEAELVHRRGDVARCAELDLEVRDEPVVLSVDVSTLPNCSDDDEPRAFDRLTESFRVCTGGDCEERETRVDEDGGVRLEGETGSFEGTLPAALMNDIVRVTLSRDADRLFAGADPDCPPLANEEDSGVELERRLIEDNAGREVERTERIDVELCGGVALELRDLLTQARAFAEAEAEAETEEP